MTKNMSLGFALVFSFAVTPAFAGDYAKFCDRTKLDALKGAQMLAEQAVKSRGSGCVGPGKDGQAASRNYPDENGERCVGVHFNHHDGSCDIQKSIGQMLQDLGG